MEIQKRICRYCNKEVTNLAGHIIRIHPAILEQLEETGASNEHHAAQTPVSAPVSPNLPGKNPQIGDISSLIKEKLEVMLNIKIIEMLSNSKNTDITDIARAINPQPQAPSLDELKKYHELVYGKDIQPPIIETGNQWVDIAQQAIPLVRDMMGRRKSPEGEQNVREGEGANISVLKPIQPEITGDSGESKGISS